MRIIGNTFGRLLGLSFLYAVTGLAILFAAVSLLGAALQGRTDDIGVPRIACLVGIQAGEDPCPQTERRVEAARAAARADVAAARQERSEARRETRLAQGQLEALERRLQEERDRLRRLERLEARSDSWTLFRDAEGVPRSGYEVETGVRFDSILNDAEPAFTWCVVKRSRAGVSESVRIESNGRRAGVSDRQAREIGLSQDEIRIAREYCRYAHEENAS